MPPALRTLSTHSPSCTDPLRSTWCLALKPADSSSLRLSPTHWDVVQPRLGMAYAFSPKMAIRAGAGSFANRTAINRDTALGGNPPFQLQEAVINGVVDLPGGAAQRAFPFTQTIHDPVFKVPTACEWNATFQREVGWGTTVEPAL